MVQKKEAAVAEAWLVVRPISGKEHMLVAAAKGQGFEVYRPTVLRQKTNKFTKQISVTTVAMFPGYVLIKATPENGWKIFSLPGAMPGDVGVLPWAFLQSFVDEVREFERKQIISDVAHQVGGKRGPVKISTLGGLVEAIAAEPVDMNRISLVTGMFKGAARVTCSIDKVIRH